MLVRMIQSTDAESFLALCHQLDRETSFMLLEPGERTTTVEEQRREIDALLSQENAALFVAEERERLVGYISGRGGIYKRERHTVYIVIGISQDFTRRGIGTRLFQALEAWARQRHLHRLELTVMAHNQAGIALYQKQGFTIEGIRRQALFVNASFIDEYYMAKLLDEAE
jgi:RimJ/RimL family protein N-acetyltransferase